QAVDAAGQRRLPHPAPADCDQRAAAGGAAGHVRAVMVLRRRRWLALSAIAVVAAVLPVVFGHRGLHAAMNIFVPGAGLYGKYWVAGIAITILAVAATVAWLRWGVDWAVVATLLLAMVVSSALARPGSTAPPRLVG